MKRPGGTTACSGRIRKTQAAGGGWDACMQGGWNAPAGWLAGWLVAGWLAGWLAGLLAGRTWHRLQQLQHAQALQADVGHTPHLPQSEHITCRQQGEQGRSWQGAAAVAGTGGAAAEQRDSSSVPWISRESSGTALGHSGGARNRSRGGPRGSSTHRTPSQNPPPARRSQ